MYSCEDFKSYKELNSFLISHIITLPTKIVPRLTTWQALCLSFLFFLNGDKYTTWTLEPASPTRCEAGAPSGPGHPCEDETITSNC